MGTHPIFESDFDCLTDLHRMLGRYLKQLSLETTARFKSGVHNVEVVPQTMKYGVWGLRKTWIKEVPVPYEPGQKVWGKEKVVVWSKWRREMVVKTKEHSEWTEKALVLRGRLSKVFVYTANKEWLNIAYRRELAKDKHQYYVANLPHNKEKQALMINDYGPIAYSALVLMNRMDCAIQYERSDLPNSPLEWVEDARALRVGYGHQIDPRDLKITALDARFSQLGYEGLENLKACKELKYLNASYARRFDNHCLTKLHIMGETLEYLDLSGSSVNVKGMGYLRLLPKLKWINLSDLPEQPDIEKFLPYIQEILPPGCTIVVNEGVGDNDKQDQKRIMSGGDSISSKLAAKTSKDIREMFKLPQPGNFIGTSWAHKHARRKKLMWNFNQTPVRKNVKKALYRKNAERYRPLM